MTTSHGSDDATLFEEWTARYQIMKDMVGELDDGENANHERLQSLLAASVTARAGMLLSLQCALLNDSDGDNYNTKSYTSTSVEALLDRIKLEIDRDAATTSQLKLLDRIANHSSRLDKVGSTSIPGDDYAEVDDDDVEAFFTDYPECIRHDWDEISDDSNDENTSDEDDLAPVHQLQPKSKTRCLSHLEKQSSKSIGKVVCRVSDPAIPKTEYRGAETRQNIPPVEAPDIHADGSFSGRKDVVHDAEEVETFSYTPPFQRPSSSSSSSSNMLASRHSHHQASAKESGWMKGERITRTNRYHPADHGNAPLTTNTSWEDHRNQQNPFQTAREYARSGVAEIQESQPRQIPQPRSSNVQNPYSRAQSNHHVEANQKVVGGPKIPDSLKRKFQPPKKTETNSKEGTRGRNQSVNKNGVNLAAQTKNKSTEDDEELPEELQHLDKELVRKIENEILESGETVTFDDIAGLEDAKQTVQEVVCWPMKRPDLFTGLRRAPNGLLLYGPPGTGKTLIGKAISHESGATFFSISSSSLTSKWIGEGEKLVRTLFAVAAYREPAVVFIDEIDSLLTQRKASENEASRRIKTEFLIQIDGTGTSGQGRVLVIGATNRPQELDEAARRRFVKRLYIPLPNEKDRAHLLNAMLRKNNHCLVDDDVKRLAKETEGFSGADLKALCNDSAFWPIRQLGPKALEVDVQDIPPISFKHFKRSLKGMKPSVAAADLVQYVEWDKIYGSKRMSEEWEDEEISD